MYAEEELSVENTKILIIEDEVIVAHDLGEMISQLGHDVVGIISSGEEAVEKAQATKPDLIIVDIKLKGEMNGIEASELITANTGAAIVYLTAHTESDLFERAKVTEPFGYLTKPVAPQDLIRTVEMALYRHRMQKRLKESESRFRAIFDQTFQFIGLMRKDGVVIEVNQAALELYGLAESDVVGIPFWRTPWWRHSAELQDRIRRAVEKAASGEFIRLETSHPGPEGELRYVDVSIKPVRDADGNISMLIPEGRDITKQKKVSRRVEGLTAIREDLLTAGSLEEKLKRITDGVVEHFDADFARIWITKPGDLCDSICIHAKVKEGPHACRYRERCLHLVASSGRYTHLDGPHHGRVPFGSYKIGRVGAGELPKFLTNEVAVDPNVHDREWARRLGLVSFAGYRLLSSDTKPVGVLGLFAKHAISAEEDSLLEGLANTAGHIVQIGVAEEALRKNELQYRQLAQNSMTGIYIIQDDQFVYVNERLAQIMGYRAEEILNKPYWEFVHPDDVDKLRKIGRDRTGDRSGPSQYDFRVVCKNGEIKWLEAFVTTIDYRGRLATMGNLANITERKEAERERALQVQFLKDIAKIERSMEDAEDLTETMANTLETSLSIFACDRAYLIYPCDPDVDRCKVVVERYVPEYAGPEGEEKVLTVSPELAESFRACIESKRPLVFHPENGLPVPDAAAAHAIKSALNMMIMPRIGSPWLLGLSQCSHSRMWTDYDQRLFQELGYRISESLNSLLLLRDLRNNEKRYRSLFQNSRDAIVITSQDGLIVEANKAFSDLFGYTTEKLRGMSAMDLWASPDDRDKWEKELKNVESLGDYELQACRKNGEIRHCLLSSSIWTAEDGSTQYQTLCRDITEHRSAQKALRESEHMFRLLSEQSLMSVCILQDGVYRYANQAMSALCESPVEEILRWNLEEFLDIVHPEDRSFVRKQARMKQLGDPGQKINYSFRIVAKSGQVKWVEVYSKTVQFHGRNANLISMIDITRRKQAEDQLRQSHKMEAIGTLAGGIAHDINNLLQVVLGQADMLRLRTGMDQESIQSIMAIRRSALNGAELVKRVLTFSRQAETEMKPLNLTDEVRRVQKLLLRTIPRMIRIEMALADNLWLIEADPSQLEQILLNLAVNAKDAMPEGGTLIFETRNTALRKEYCETHPEVQQGKYVMLTVSDTGQGIEKHVIERVFEPFFSTKAPGEGTGLGLSTVFGIVKNHGGHINCYSESGVGTTFKIYFPVASVDLPAAVADTVEMPAGGTETLLLVDDEEAVLNLGTEMLELAGYTVLTASNGREALRIFSRDNHLISLVILDLVMPEMSGRKCLDEILRINPAMRVLIASGYSANGPARDALQSGATGFISKPFDLKQLLQAVRAALDVPLD